MMEPNITELVAEVAIKRKKDERKALWRRRINRIKCFFSHDWRTFETKRCRAYIYNMIHGYNKVPATASIQYCAREGCGAERGFLDSGFNSKVLPVSELYAQGYFEA